jgi:16S rRNA (adenine1518-N6/adenine1519-N6)-dimethyltransferase
VPYHGLVVSESPSRQRQRPRKSLGQHWLADRRYVSRIVAAADIRPGETIIEVGAGAGALTGLLAERASRLVVVELDNALAEALKLRFQSRREIQVLNADVLSLSPKQLLTGHDDEPYAVIGNFPYFIGSAILRHFLYADRPPERIVATLQAEVAQNVAARPGAMGYLSVEMQLTAEARLLFSIPPRAFRPPPKVRSAVVRLDRRERRLLPEAERAAFLELARAGFAAPRKQLRNSLAVGLRIAGEAAQALLQAAGIDPTRRPQTLSLEEWLRLFAAWRSGR